MLKYITISNIAIPMFNIMIALGLLISIISLYLRTRNNKDLNFLEKKALLFDFFVNIFYLFC